ncbi:SSI family serine proteinase inhibitor [Streptomyces sp. NPDC057099]|uniref:SSI family serine proteinase inhibitor n=1 Tax=Streptomyces sp. NPDC057099 TaxID=3346019 RepID=UPI0036441E88
MSTAISRATARTAPRTTPRTGLRRLALGAAASVAALGALAAVSPAAYGQAGLGEVKSKNNKNKERDHLTVTVRNAGNGADGTFELYCGPAGGSHPDPSGACAALERDTRWGQETFAPAPKGGFCTMQYGGPATARVTGTWAGRPVDATYDRRDGCQISRWDRLVPLLPDMRAGQGA